MEPLMALLKDLHPDVDFENETALVDADVLDSLDIVILIGEINDAFDIEITTEHLVPENFNSYENMLALVKSLSEA